MTFAKRVPAAALICGLLIVPAIAQAAGHLEAPILKGRTNAAIPGSCDIDVPGLGLTFVVDVLSTEYLLSMNRDTGAVRYIEWNQILEELMIPVPPSGASTGRFTVIPGAPTVGAMDPATGLVLSTGTWSAYFDDSATIPVGIFSPFIVDNDMEGSLIWDTPLSGRGTFVWSGESTDPISGLSFSFRCEANTVFTVQPGHTHDKGSSSRFTGPPSYEE
jgi:hypothetical protein